MQSSNSKPPRATVPTAVPDGRVRPTGSRAAESREFDSEALFGTANEILIRHEDMLYRLRRTGQGKLILTK
ncbi:MAG TPA: hemin uptake protein HemP [Methylibium sp.]|nr:hemin uptake protein HemP [Methylibium sp.]